MQFFVLFEGNDEQFKILDKMPVGNINRIGMKLMQPYHDCS